MNEFKGTKGKWYVVKTGDHPTNKGEQVSFIQTETHAFDLTAMQNDLISRSEFEANSKLISYAPEMLYVLMGIVDSINEDTYPLGIIATNRIKKAKELIIKATTI